MKLMSKENFVIIFDSQVFINVLILEEEQISGSKTKTFLPTPSMGRHGVRSNQTKEEVRFKISEKLGRAESQRNLLEPKCGKELQPLQLTGSKEIYENICRVSLLFFGRKESSLDRRLAFDPQ